MKDLTAFIIEADKNSQNQKPGESWVKIEIISLDKEDTTKEKHSTRVVSYNTYMEMKKNGRASNGEKIISVNAISPSYPSKEQAQEYKKNK